MFFFFIDNNCVLEPGEIPVGVMGINGFDLVGGVGSDASFVPAIPIAENEIQGTVNLSTNDADNLFARLLFDHSIPNSTLIARSSSCHFIVQPPSTVKICPVTICEKSHAR